ncbi:MAG TPA: DUF2062 domain-containing protein [Steroidobacteraceae bacterium]|jgi:uncharacterized protein (DUF2062 family)
MPRRVFKPLSRQRHVWKDRWYMRPFRLLLEHPAYWSLNRRSVTRALALGLFIAFVPLPIHVLLSTLLALLLRLNVPVAVAGTFIANPFTMVPMFMSAYWLGCRLLGVTAERIPFELTWTWLSTTLVPIWKPFLLGCLILGTTAAVIGYVALGGIWHLSLVLKYHKRKEGGARKDSVIDKK